MRRIARALMVLLLAQPAFAYAQSGVATTTGPVTTVDIQGLKRLTPANVLALGQITTGRPWTTAELDAVVKRLLDTGLFSSIQYRFQSMGRDVRLTLEIEEPVWNVSVTFDNFVWMSDDKIAQAISAAIPTFDGKVPDTKEVVDVIARVLDGLLAEQHLPGHVTHLATTSLGVAGHRERFFVTGAPLPLCEIQFPGATPAFAADLIKASAFFVGQPYSREETKLAIQGNLIDVYRRQGRLRAEFQPAEATPLSSSKCPSGVVAKVPVTEGPVFTLKAFSWSGNSALTSQQLEAASSLRAGERADSTKLNAALSSVRNLYGQRGYLEFVAEPRLDFDETQPLVSYTLDVREGAVYSMGKITVTGATPAETEALVKAWPIKTGAPYDAVAASGYAAKVFQARILPGGRRLDTAIQLDRAAHIANVVVTVRGSGLFSTDFHTPVPGLG